jgi:dTDP-glucose pyrophosphorylase
MKDFNHLTIQESTSLVEALKQMDKAACKLLMVYKEDLFVNLLTIGDIQRALISGIELNTPISNIEIGEKLLATTDDDRDKVIRSLIAIRAEFMPILDEQGEIVDIIFWDEVSEESLRQSEALKDTPVVLMAGGQGTRLRPITNIIPKPLIPIGEFPVIHQIIRRFQQFSSKEFHVSVNYKWQMIQQYFEDLEESIDVQYYKEDKPLGTAGSLALMKSKLDKTFFVSNCDIIVDDDYEAIFNYHKKNRNDVTIVACVNSYDIPYGVIHTDENGLYQDMTEKPTINYLLNTGMYVLEPSLLEMVEEGRIFHITELIAKAKDQNKRIGVFPITEKSWIDIGEWKGYLNTFMDD